MVWGKFPQREVEADRVAYLSADQLVEWLQCQPTSVSEERRRALFEAIIALTG